MMKQHFNLLRMVVFAILFVAGSFPAPLFAKESATSARTRVDHASFCASIDTLGAKVADDIALRQAHDERKRTRDRDVLLRRLTGRDRAMADARSSWDSKRDQLYVKLEHRAKTDAQRAAIALFKTHVDTIQLTVTLARTISLVQAPSTTRVRPKTSLFPVPPTYPFVPTDKQFAIFASKRSTATDFCVPSFMVKTRVKFLPSIEVSKRKYAIV
jgi:hypothetical protein